jgi:hypothetical protein
MKVAVEVAVAFQMQLIYKSKISEGFSKPRRRKKNEERRMRRRRRRTEEGEEEEEEEEEVAIRCR